MKKKNKDPLTNQSFFDSPISNQHLPSLVDGFVFSLYFQDFGNIEKMFLFSSRIPMLSLLISLYINPITQTKQNMNSTNQSKS